MNQAKKRKLSGNDDMQEMDTGELDIGSFNVGKKVKEGEGLEDHAQVAHLVQVGRVEVVVGVQVEILDSSARRS